MKGHRKKPKGKRTESMAKKFSNEGEEKILAIAKDLIEPFCEAEGMELVHLEYQRETGGRILRLYIDKPGGVTIDDCAYVNRQAGDLLDVYIDSIGPYSLEVSSPGLSRPLGKKIDFDRFKGSIVKIRTAQPINGQRKFTGILLGISKEMIKISLHDNIVDIPYQEITKAHLVD